MLRHLARHRVRYAVAILVLAFAAVTVLKTRGGEWFSFR